MSYRLKWNKGKNWGNSYGSGGCTVTRLITCAKCNTPMKKILVCGIPIMACPRCTDPVYKSTSKSRARDSKRKQAEKELGKDYVKPIYRGLRRGRPKNGR